MTDHITPIELRDSGGVYIYYALPVVDGGWGVFEHVSSHANQDYAQAAIAELIAADARRRELAAKAREAIEAWPAAVDGPSADGEHAAAIEVAGALGALLDALQESNLI